MTPDELSFQELAAELARIEQESAELRAKLTHLSADFAMQEAFNQLQEVALSTIQFAPTGHRELEMLSAEQERKLPATTPASTQSPPDRKPKNLPSISPPPIPGAFTRRPGRHLFFIGTLLLLGVLVLLSGDTPFVSRTVRTGLTPTPNSQAIPSVAVTPGFAPEATSTLATSADACVNLIEDNPNKPTWTATATPTSAIAEFPIPVPPGSSTTFVPDSSPQGIVAGPDGNLWFTESISGGAPIPVDQIGRMTPTGTITEFTVPTIDSVPGGITVGPDGNLWFTESGGNQIGQITPAGTITEFAIPTPGSGSGGIAAGPDGNLWFTESDGNQIGRITPTGTISEFALPKTHCAPGEITAGSDGNLWFTESNGNQIGRITPTGTITEFALPSPGSEPGGIVAGPDGNLWFTELNGNQIGRITPAGTITEFATFYPEGITVGPDGNLWFTEAMGGRIGRITPAGKITEFMLSAPRDGPVDITKGPDSNLWFTDMSNNAIGRILLGE